MHTRTTIWMTMGMICLLAGPSWAMRGAWEMQQGLLKAASLQTSSGGLFGAVKAHNENRVRYLVDTKQEDINQLDIEGKIPLHYAVQNDNDPLRAWLVNSSGKGILLLLIDEDKTNVNAQDKYGNTPMHYAAGEGKKWAIELLLKNGALVYLQNNNGDTPADLAQKNGHEKLAQTLQIALQSQLEPFRKSLRTFDPNFPSEVAHIIFELAGYGWKSSASPDTENSSSETSSWVSRFFCSGRCCN